MTKTFLTLVLMAYMHSFVEAKARTSSTTPPCRVRGVRRALCEISPTSAPQMSTPSMPKPHPPAMPKPRGGSHTTTTNETMHDDHYYDHEGASKLVGAYVVGAAAAASLVAVVLFQSRQMVTADGTGLLDDEMKSAYVTMDDSKVGNVTGGQVVTVLSAPLEQNTYVKMEGGTAPGYEIHFLVGSIPKAGCETDRDTDGGATCGSNSTNEDQRHSFEEDSSQASTHDSDDQEEEGKEEGKEEKEEAIPKDEFHDARSVDDEAFNESPREAHDPTSRNFGPGDV